MPTLKWEQKRLERATALPLVALRLPHGDRFYSYVNPGDAVISYGESFDASASFDADGIYDGGAPYEERGARLIAIEPLEETLVPLQGDILAALGQSDRPSVRFRLSNEDEEMSKLSGEEYLLNQVCEVYVTFPGLGIQDAELKFRGRVRRFSLRKESLDIEAVVE